MENQAQDGKRERIRGETRRRAIIQVGVRVNVPTVKEQSRPPQLHDSGSSHEHTGTASLGDTIQPLVVNHELHVFLMGDATLSGHGDVR